jgi:hypothetical protein
MLGHGMRHVHSQDSQHISSTVVEFNAGYPQQKLTEHLVLVKCIEANRLISYALLHFSNHIAYPTPSVCVVLTCVQLITGVTWLMS